MNGQKGVGGPPGGKEQWTPRIPWQSRHGVKEEFINNKEGEKSLEKKTKLYNKH